MLMERVIILVWCGVKDRMSESKLWRELVRVEKMLVTDHYRVSENGTHGAGKEVESVEWPST